VIFAVRGFGFEFGKPGRAEEAVGAELFHFALIFAVEEGALGTEAGGDGGVHEVAGIVGVHLEEDAHFEFAHRAAVEVTLKVCQIVAPEHDEDADRGAFADELGEGLVGLFFFTLFAAEAEIVVGLAEVAEALDAVEEDERRRFRAFALDAEVDFLAEILRRSLKPLGSKTLTGATAASAASDSSCGGSSAGPEQKTISASA
jgi:hypothetical protein